jgi:hypothetical protein
MVTGCHAEVERWREWMRIRKAAEKILRAALEKEGRDATV